MVIMIDAIVPSNATISLFVATVRAIVLIIGNNKDEVYPLQISGERVLLV